MGNIFAGAMEMTLRRLAPDNFDVHRGPYRFVALDEDPCWISLSCLLVRDKGLGRNAIRRATEEDLSDGAEGEISLLAPYKVKNEETGIYDKIEFYAGHVDQGRSLEPLELPQAVRSALGSVDVFPGMYTYVYGPTKPKTPRVEIKFNDDQRDKCNALFPLPPCIW